VGGGTNIKGMVKLALALFVPSLTVIVWLPLAALGIVTVKVMPPFPPVVGEGGVVGSDAVSNLAVSGL
jgi:hypothetical protein